MPEAGPLPAIDGGSSGNPDSGVAPDATVQQPAEDDGGCAVGPGSSGAGAAGAFAAFAALALVIRRRR